MPRLSTTIRAEMTYSTSFTPVARYFCTRASSLERERSLVKSFIRVLVTTRHTSRVTAAERTFPRVSDPMEKFIRSGSVKEDMR